MSDPRVYLDWNATAPLRPEVRGAMIAAMDALGNPSSVHAEGRAAKGLIEIARDQVARAVGCKTDEVIFTSGATEAAAMVHQGLMSDGMLAAEIEHDCVLAHTTETLGIVRSDGSVAVSIEALDGTAGIALQAANSETGVLQDVDAVFGADTLQDTLTMTDAVQLFGKRPYVFNWGKADMALLSAHKIGGPKGVGALILKKGLDVEAMLTGGGQEMGRRSGTENVLGIVGFGAAAEASMRDLEAGVWDRVEKLRNILEKALASAEKETIFVGQGAERLPNTSCIVAPGWKGETQVMLMDLVGFAISAGSACSSGKVRESRVLKAMGYSDDHARSAIRVSIGPTTTEDEVLRFAEAWTAAYDKTRQRAA